MTNLQFFEIVADSAILCIERNVTEVLTLRGIDRSQWPKPWPLTRDNSHGTLNDVVLRTALASMDDLDGQHAKFVDGWGEWLQQCSAPLTTIEEVAHRCQHLEKLEVDQ